MKGNIYIKNLHLYCRDEDVKMQSRQVKILRYILMKVSELAAKLNNQTATVEKIITEIQALKVALEDVDLPEEAITALNRLDDALTVADDLNPDALVVEEPVAG